MPIVDDANRPDSTGMGRADWSNDPYAIGANPPDIVSNQIKYSGTGGGAAYLNAPILGVDAVMGIQLPTVPTGFWVAFALYTSGIGTTAQTGYEVDLTGPSTVELYKVNSNASQPLLNTFTKAMTAGDYIFLVFKPTATEVWHNTVPTLYGATLVGSNADVAYRSDDTRAVITYLQGSTAIPIDNVFVWSSKMVVAQPRNAKLEAIQRARIRPALLQQMQPIPSLSSNISAVSNALSLPFEILKPVGPKSLTWSTPVTFATNVSNQLEQTTSRGNTVWYAYQDGSNIKIRKSVDEGVTWGSDITVTAATALPLSYAFTVDPVTGTLHMMYYTGTNPPVLCYRRSTDGGTTWSTEATIEVGSGATFYRCTIRGYNGVVYRVWANEGATPAPLQFQKSTDDGASWGSVTNPSTTTTASRPVLSVDGTTVHVTWEDKRAGSYFNVFYTRSTNSGTSFAAEVQVTATASGGAGAFRPDVLAIGSEVINIWQDDQGVAGEEELFIRHSSDGGATWGAIRQLTFAAGASEHAAMSYRGNIVFLAWMDWRSNPYPQIWTRLSYDYGISWGLEQQIFSSAEYQGGAQSVITDNYITIMPLDYPTNTFSLITRAAIPDTGAIEWTQGIAQTKSLPFEWTSLAAVSQALSLPLEWAQAVTASSGLSYEWAQALSNSLGLPLEITQGIVNSSSTPLELLQGIAQALSLPAEILKGVATAISLPLESILPIVQSLSLPLETLQGIAQTYSLPYESVLPLSNALSLPLEWVLSVTQSYSTPSEWQQGVAASTGVPLEIIQGIARVLALPFETLQGVGQAFGLSYEWASPVSQATGLPLEFVQGVLATSTTPLEFLQGVASAIGLPLEWLGLAAVSQALSLPLEWVAPALSALSLPLETVQPISASAVAPLEITQGLVATSPLWIESQQGIASSYSLPLEWLGGAGTPVSQAIALPLEWVQGVARPLGLPVEWNAGIVQAIVLPLEAQQNLVASKQLPAELMKGVTQAPPLSFEALQGIVRQSDLPFEWTSLLILYTFYGLHANGSRVQAHAVARVAHAQAEAQRINPKR